MRNHYQRRSLSSFFIWTTALVAIGLAASWQFHWWPTAEIDSEEAASKQKRTGAESPPGSLVLQASHETAAKPRPTDDLFASQTEPELPDLAAEIPPFDPANRPDFPDFPKPPQLLPANPDAKPIPAPSRLVQTVEGELPPWEPISEPPMEFSPKSPIKLLADEKASSSEPLPGVLPAEMAAVAGKIKQIDDWLAGSDPKQELSAHKELSTLYWEHPEWRDFLRSRIE
jgi:hypothetical protein